VAIIFLSLEDMPSNNLWKMQMELVIDEFLSLSQSTHTEDNAAAGVGIAGHIPNKEQESREHRTQLIFSFVYIPGSDPVVESSSCLSYSNQ
ncbi:hypothetical protein STEG23_015287, partial [Scotinomys teguina]